MCLHNHYNDCTLTAWSGNQAFYHPISIPAKYLPHCYFNPLFLIALTTLSLWSLYWNFNVIDQDQIVSKLKLCLLFVKFIAYNLSSRH